MLNRVFLIAFISLTACTTSRYVSDRDLCLTQKEAKEIALLNQPPKKAVVRLGICKVKGTYLANDRTCITAAKHKAANMGADFIVMENEGVDSQTVYVPGTCTSQTDGFGFVSTTHTEGQIYDVESPWIIFSFWAYSPVDIGLKMDGDRVSGFKLNSDAENSGIRIGDQIAGIDGIDIDEEDLICHLMNLVPGDRVSVQVRRGSNRVDLPVTLLSN